MPKPSNDPFAQYYTDPGADESDPFAQYYTDEPQKESGFLDSAKDAGMSALEGVGEALQFVDKYSMAPVRTGMREFQKGAPLSEIPGKMYDQFGEDPSKAF